MTEMLWSDPGPNQGLIPSKRGVGLPPAFLSSVSSLPLPPPSPRMQAAAQWQLCAHYDSLWSCLPGFRGVTDWLLAGVAFGADVTERFLKANGLELLIRCACVCMSLSAYVCV
jgi:hypothetical protein